MAQECIALDLSNGGLPSFPSWKSVSPVLESVDLSETNIHDESIAMLVHRCKGLRELRLRRCEQLTDDALYAISASARVLRVLELAYCSDVSERGLQGLECTETLQELDIAGTGGADVHQPLHSPRAGCSHASNSTCTALSTACTGVSSNFTLVLPALRRLNIKGLSDIHDATICRPAPQRTLQSP